MKRFSTAVSACVQGGLMTSQRAQSYCRSGETSGLAYGPQPVARAMLKHPLKVLYTHLLCFSIKPGSSGRRPAIRPGVAARR